MTKSAAAGGGVRDLVARYGITPLARRVSSPFVPPDVDVYSASYGDISWLVGGVADGGHAHRARVGASHWEGGSGRAFGDPALASVIAIAEAAERYASACAAGSLLMRETADALGGSAIDFSAIPRCSAAEYATGRCPLRPPDATVPIRWVSGVSLVTGSVTWVPAVMAYQNLPALGEGERFWYRISTGCGVHETPEKALIAGICEVIERDAVAVVWLQRIPLPPLTPDALSRRAVRLIEWNQERFVTTYLFDATTDVGVPTVYCLQAAEHADRAARLVGCATGLTHTEAAERALLEVTAVRPVVQRLDPAGTDMEDGSSVTASAAYMGHPDRVGAFDFLTDGYDARPVSAADAGLRGPDGEVLDGLIARLEARGMDVYAVDLTTDELAGVGLTAVRVIAPALQPMSLLPGAQYRGHPRLYDAPRSMGYPARAEADLNPWPQPFT